MKRRVVAVTLSLIMTMATVSEAGAAVFTSPDGDDNVIVQQSEEVNDTVSIGLNQFLCYFFR